MSTVTINGESLDMMSLDKLRRRRDQAWEMAGLARQDRDYEDEKRRTAEARLYEDAIAERVREGS